MNIQEYILLIEEYRPHFQTLPYGFWITNTGNIIDVPEKYKHCDYAPNGISSALKEGWFRIISSASDDGNVDLIIELKRSAIINTPLVVSLKNLFNRINQTHTINSIMIERMSLKYSETEYEHFTFFNTSDPCKKAISWLCERVGKQ